MAWYHAQFTTRRFNPNPVPLTALPTTSPNIKTPAPDALFGPPIGPVPPAPAWTALAANTPKRLVDADELTPDTVRTWIEKSKLPSTATTTLQAQVNLRRPTLRLAPLTDVSALEGVSLKDAPHMLAFTFDCSAPQCGVHVQVLLPAAHPDAPPHGGPLKVFDAVVPGGFARTLGAADSAVLELARFERMPVAAPSATPAPAEPEATAAAPAKPDRKRFTPFHFRRRANASSASATSAASPSPATGAPLAVVDGHSAAETGTAKADESDNDAAAVRITIRLVALDAQGRELDAPNEHTVYLAVGRMGAPAPPPASSPAAEEGEKDKDQAGDAEEDKDPDTRAWIVRVVRREATIGPHTFALHEIYGLGAGAAATPAPPPTTTTTMTYPPTTAAPPDDDPPERECLLCLSSPREVVLLPCRHLVACRPCAVNMVEFGAGGAITAASEAEPTPAPAPVAAAAPEGEGEAAASPPDANANADAPSPPDADSPAAPAAPTPATPATPVVTTRRKRKAKGWFCPVCRQPYTSLLRITTAPPPAPDAPGTGEAPTSPMSPSVVEAEGTAGSATASTAGGTAGSANASTAGGILGGLRRPGGFLRGLSGRGRVGDVEAQV